MGFAIPINNVLSLISKITNKELKISNNIGEIGIYGQEIDGTIKELLNADYGIYITKIQEDSIALKAGLKVGDILIGIDNSHIQTFDDFHRALNQTTSSEIKLIYLVKQGDSWTEKSVNVTFR